MFICFTLSTLDLTTLAKGPLDITNFVLYNGLRKNTAATDRADRNTLKSLANLQKVIRFKIFRYLGPLRLGPTQGRPGRYPNMAPMRFF
jgi:hypothetical protein